MIRNAINEVRFHPGRIVATLIAIAISIGFMAAVSTFVTTQGSALGKMNSVAVSKADLAVSIQGGLQDTTSSAKVLDVIRKQDGVQLAEKVNRGGVNLAKGDKAQQLETYATPSEPFRWSSLAAGAWPKGESQVAISQQAADKLGVVVGDSVDASGHAVTISGITKDAPSLFLQVGYVDPATMEETGGWGDYVIQLADGADEQATITKLHAALAPMVSDADQVAYPGGPKNLTVDTGKGMTDAAGKTLMGDFEPIKFMLLSFSAIAAVVGMIIISNTFTILLAQRRRQIGLLRAVGASGTQVRRQFLAESVLIGILGSALGIALGVGLGVLGAWFTKALFFGLDIPWRDLLVEFVIGVVLTVLAAMLPSLRATRVAPLEALQPVATSEQQRKASRVRALVCGTLVLLGALLAARALTMHIDPQVTPDLVTGPVVSAVLGGALISLGVLGGAELFIPTVLRLLGKVFGLAGPSARLAGENAVRNPRRAAATATALMLAIGLIVTLQVGTATGERTALAEIEKSYPVDLMVSTIVGSSESGKPEQKALPADVVTRLDNLGNISSRTKLKGVNASTEQLGTISVLSQDEGVTSIAQGLPTASDSMVLVSGDWGGKPGDPVKLVGPNGTVTLKAHLAKGLGWGMVLVSPATMAKLTTAPQTLSYWLQVDDPDEFGATMKGLEQLQQDGAVQVSGSIVDSMMIKQVLNILLLVTTALLGVAVLIALIGVGNTLGLSVIERARESALLRALGMQKGSLRFMLLVEALMLALAGVLVGVGFGCFFGWLGVSALLKQATLTTAPTFAINWPQTLGMVLVAVLAATLASLLPGRRAANATPTEALAEA